MKKIIKLLTGDYRNTLLITFFIILTIFPICAQYTLTDEEGYVGIYDYDYGNNMNVYWDINTGVNKPLVFYYYTGLSEYTADYVNVYEVNESGYLNLICTLSGSSYGEVKTTIPSGRARIEFITDSYDSYFDGNYSLFGFDLSYGIDYTEYVPENLNVTYNTYVSGNIEIGTRIPYANSELLVKGKIKARNVQMTTTGWADFVFDSDYILPELRDVERYILANRHLPGIPTAAEVKAKGIEIAGMQVKLLQKIEELTLYLIQHEKDIEELKEE
jgi:hypothetical protein